MSPAAASHVVEEQTSNDQGGRIVDQPSASDAPENATKRQPASQTKRWFFHFEIGIKKTVRTSPERPTELRATQPADRSGGAVPQVRMITAASAPGQGVAMAMPSLLPNESGTGGGSGSSSTSYSVYTQTDTGYTVSPPNTASGGSD
ncbi:MAG TPA: hypothetical protein VKY89_11215 [Thermoanaerobaculia bacterium]|nr:hypothetical protein [Thermoanaerobaculia bacterium]